MIRNVAVLILILSPIAGFAAEERHLVALLEPSRGRMLTLISCHPFDAIRPGSHLRYVVVAAAV
jgi:hypothetical protein